MRCILEPGLREEVFDYASQVNFVEQSWKQSKHTWDNFYVIHNCSKTTFETGLVDSEIGLFLKLASNSKWKNFFKGNYIFVKCSKEMVHPSKSK